ncbi:flagella synthesis protein FlgN [Zhongshania sp. BJYM1]|uniref:flagella synthesis protein FlgN n=1 Tax=Zhongshania aquatica TaxID=2965069 RepID=UPI0022B45091|nr:flagellar export chaperone FlgN [Marortus sp. BJYM1]
MMTELSDILQHIQKHARELESVLLKEAATLSRADSAEMIEMLAIQKMDLVQTLDQLALRRRQIVDEAGGNDLSNSNEDWQDSLAILARCQSLNTQVGSDISAQARYKQRALEILGAVNTETTLYSASGAAQYAGAKQALGKA